MSCGKYQIYVEDEGVSCYEPREMTLKDLREVYDSIWRYHSYNSTEDNCKA